MQLITIVQICFSLFSFVTVLAGPISKHTLGIIGGHDATEGQFPYTVSIQQCGGSNCAHHCSGSVIAPTWILTTASCYNSSFTNKVLAGVLKLNENSDYKQLLEVNRSINHEKYGGSKNPINDIGLMQLKTPLTYNARVLPINLPSKGLETLGAATCAGWGDTTGQNNLPNTLQYISFTIIDGNTCKREMDQTLGPQQHDPFDASVHICTSDDSGGKAVCSKDGGAPLVQNGTLVGIASWGVTPCGSRGAPSVYTKVSNFIDWIAEHMQS